MKGTLYVVATPIGNLSDMTLRAIDVLKSSDFIACEDTRHTLNLLNHFGFRKPLLRYDEHTHEKSSAAILEHLHHGKNVCLVTDAGTPGISDPGVRLINEARKRGETVCPIPGPSSVTAAVSASGFGQNGFIFHGFLPRRSGRAKRMLKEGFGLGKTTVIFESPFRVGATLQLIHELDEKADVVLARELTKIHEEFLKGTAEEIMKIIETRDLKGEVVLIVEPTAATKKSKEEQD